ncbi:MAG: fibronectin type III domain-containing protein [Elusimicrobiota bacterium]
MTNNTIATSIDTLASIPQPYASSATIVVSADSQPGFLSDYNSFYDFKDAESFSWGGSTYSGLAAWTAATGQDTHSFNALPLWKSTAQYTEDFHPLSATGRYDPVLDSFVLDPETSLTIDAGDPARDFALEPAPNGGRVNLGSYGNTVEASKSAPAPATSVLGGVFFTSATISYGAVSADGYRVDASTHSDFSSGIISSTTANTALTQLSVQGLSSNATYYFRAGATYGANHSFRNTVPFSSTTLANLPASPSSEVHTSSLAFYWGANGNAEDTPYLAQISTDDFSTVNLTTSVLAVSTTFQTLVPNTTYYLRVRAQARSGSFTDYAEAVPAITHAAAPSALMSSAHISSAALSWEVGANPAGTEYLAQISTDEFSTVNLSSRTLAASATFQALVPNTTYYLRVHAFNAAGIPTEDALASPVLTPAESPGGVVVVDVSSEALTVDWSGGANPVGTVYEAFTSTDDFATVNVSSRTLALSATFYGLAPYTTYYLRVSASNYGGVLSDLSAVESTRTWPAPPAAPGTPAGTALGVSSISWTWAAAPYAASYTVRPATDSATVIGSTAAPAYHQTGLAPNTTFSIVVAALNVSGSGPASSPSPAVYTLANPPSGLTTTAIHLTSASVQWGLNGNTAFTQAALERSTDSASFSSVFSGVAVDFTDTELSECSTYYFRARNQNGGGFLTDYSSVLSFMTESSTASPASALSAEALSGDRITLSWTPSVSANVAQYRLYYDAGTGTIDYGSALSVLSSTETHWTTGVLASSGAYKFALRAKNTCGYEETEGVFASVAATATLTEVRAAIRAPASGQHIKGNSVTFLAETLAGASADVRRVVFQYRPSGTQPWSDIPAANAENPNPDLLSPYFIQSDVDAWGAGAYDVRALAVDVAGSSDTAPSVITVTVEAFAADADINENLVSGKVEKAQEVSNAVTTTLYAAGGGTDDPAARLILPSGVLPVSTVTVTLACDPVIGTAAPAGYSFVGSAVRITLSGGLSSLNGAAQVTLSYPSTLADTSGLRMQSLNEATGQWSQLTGLTLDTARRTATAQTTHFSVFALVTGSQAAADLSHVRVYPVPYKPNGGNSDEGVPYAAGNTDSGIIFDNLPRSAEITVYTLSGRRVTKFSAESVSGRVQWDVRNDSGQAVASGGYLAVIRSPGMPEIVKKLLIIR